MAIPISASELEEQPSSSTELEEREEICLHSRFASWMHALGFGHLCEEQPSGISGQFETSGGVPPLREGEAGDAVPPETASPGHTYAPWLEPVGCRHKGGA